MTNPFENEDGKYYALINGEGQYSLWPAFANIPEGWVAVYGADNRTACLEFIAKHWTDMRPISLRQTK